jgi:hypothetical protein
MDLDSDPAIFVIDLQGAWKKISFVHIFFCFLLFEATSTSFFMEKKSKKSHISRNQGFSLYFCMMIEGSGSRAGSRSRAGSGSVHPDPGGQNTYGSGGSRSATLEQLI